MSTGVAEKADPFKRYAVKYPWDAWFARRRVVLREGRDYQCTQAGMTVNVRQAARLRGLRVRIDQGRGTITVTVKE